MAGVKKQSLFFFCSAKQLLNKIDFAPVRAYIFQSSSPDGVRAIGQGF